MPYFSRRGPYRPNMTGDEPSEAPFVCLCSKCRQEVYPEEYTFKDGLGAELCPECFEEMITQRLRANPSLLAMELGYEVTRYEA